MLRKLPKYVFLNFLKNQNYNFVQLRLLMNNLLHFFQLLTKKTISRNFCYKEKKINEFWPCKEPKLQNFRHKERNSRTCNKAIHENLVTRIPKHKNWTPRNQILAIFSEPKYPNPILEKLVTRRPNRYIHMNAFYKFSFDFFLQRAIS